MRQLVVQLQDGSRRTLPVTTTRITIGRSADNELAYPDDPVLSRRHALIECEDGIWFAEDLGSKNGTNVNGERLVGRRQLGAADRVSAGHVTVYFEDPQMAHDQTLVFVPDAVSTRIASVSTNLDRLVSSNAGSLEEALRGSALAGTPRINALLEAGRELAGHRPLEELFEVILNLAIKSVGASRGVLATVEDSGIMVRANRGEGFRVSQAVRDQVLEGRNSLLITDTAQNEMLRESYTIVAGRVKSLMAVPLQTQEKVIGMIYVDSPDFVRPFTAEDLNLLTVMANVAAVRIEHARLVEVEQTEKVMSKELAQAAEIQRNLLPRGAPHVAGLDIAGQSFPCRSVGGDYFDYLPLAGGRLGVIVADVAGKGLAAALLMSSLQARVQLLSEETDELATLVARLNRSVATTCPGNRFITFFMAVFDPATGEFEFVNAGHNPPYLIRASGEVRPLEAGGPVLGIIKSAPYQSGKLSLGRGDTLVLYSDGLPEANNPAGDEYGDDELLRGLLKVHKLTAAEIVAGVSQQLEQFMGVAPATDDMTLVVVKR